MNAALPISSMWPAAGVSHFPVVIIGAGPTGLTLANLLGVYGVPVLVLERNTNTVGEPRAVTIDDESLRTIQATGLIRQVLPSVVQGYGVHYFSWRNREFARIEPSVMDHGFPKRNAFRQQLLVGQLRDGMQRFADSSIWFGHELITFKEDGVEGIDGIADADAGAGADADAGARVGVGVGCKATQGKSVHLEVRHGNDIKHISCNWLVACDGGRSSVREQLGITLTGSSYDEKWLIVDLLERGNPFRHTSTYCDPVRPAIRLPGPQGTLRYEFMLHEGEDAEKVLEETNVRAWIHQRNPADAELAIARKVVYAFHARVAEQWKSGRVFLAGDAAHLTPPFAGQGMNSGVRDAANLAWKLAAVVEGDMHASLLDTYEQERKPHAGSLIKMAVRIGKFMQPKSVLAAMLTQGALKVCSLYPPVRDYVLQLKFKPKPRFFKGFFVGAVGAMREARSGAQVPAGQLLPQPMVELPGGAHVLLDDVLGPGFALLTLAGFDASSSLTQLAAAGLSCCHVRLVAQCDDFVTAMSQHAPGLQSEVVVRDLSGTLERIIHSATNATNATSASKKQVLSTGAMLLRPDRYVLAYLDSGANSVQSHSHALQLIGQFSQRSVQAGVLFNTIAADASMR